MMKCPKCGSEMGFGFEHGTPAESTETDFWWCPRCGYEEKVGGDPSVH
jgi:DNA-directed RNA polymerase subunit M/transcription elongation factor TFIIS